MKTAWILATFALCTGAQAADLSLEVDKLDTTRLSGASLMVGVHTEAGTWLRQPAMGLSFALRPSTGGRWVIELKGLPEGPIALSLFQDTNGNGKLDTNLMGIPTEPYGFSNNAAGNFGPPSFEQAVFVPLAGKPLRISLN